MRVFSILLYILSVMAANLTAARFVEFGPFTLAIGTLFFGCVFTARDAIHRLYNRQMVYQVIGGVVMLSILQSTFLDVPVRIIIASAIAMALSELADTEVYQTFLARSWAGRVARSNAVAVPLDTTLFTCTAFLGVLPWQVLVSVIITDILAKYLISVIIIAPVGMAMNATLKTA